jgi:hypothetical protein
VDDDAPPLASAEEIAELVHTYVDPTGFEESGPMSVLRHRLLGTPLGLRGEGGSDFPRKVRAYLADREAEALRPVTVTIRAFTVPGPVASGPGRTVPEEGARLLAHGEIPTIFGRTGSVMIGNTANYIADYDVEVAQEARIADPIIGQSFGGLVANVRPNRSADGRSVSLDLELLLSRRLGLEPAFDTGAQTLGPVERYTELRALVSTTLEIPAGGTSVLDLGVDPRAGDRRVVAEIRLEMP